MTDDDVWAPDDDVDQVSYDQKIAQREWEKMNEVHGNEGYKDGIVAGKDITIQEGFNTGYKEGVALGRQFGKLRGITSTLLVYYTQVQKDVLDAVLLEKSTQLHNELAAFGVEDLYTKEYFRGPSTADEKKSDQCCGKGSCSDAQTSDEAVPQPSSQASGSCCKGQGSSTCRSTELPKPVDPAAVVASYQKRVDELVSQLPLPRNTI